MKIVDYDIGDLGIWLRTDDQIQRDPLDLENVEWLRDELWWCENKCEHPKPPSNFLPTRLVDVGSQETGGPRLITTELFRDDTASLTTVKYAALSYCWGPEEDAARQLITTKSNFETHCQGIPEDQLTPVIKDSLRVCQSLHIKYIWIDALCIIQGDADDWDYESERMGLIYYHSCVTICSLASRSCLEGFLSPRPAGIKIYFQSAIHNDIHGCFTIYECHNDKDGFPRRTPHIPCPRSRDIEQSQWLKRGWTLQEGDLSSRLLMFGKHMIHWVCESGEVSENSHCDHDPNIINGFRDFISMALAEDRSERIKGHAYRTWSNIICVNGRQYTYGTDFFPSIAGIARHCGEVLEDTYMAGLWKQNLHYDLLWDVRDPPIGNLDSTLEALSHPDPYIAPSWSWASRLKHGFEFHVSLYYFVPGIESSCSDIPSMPYATGAPIHIRSEIRCVDHHVELAGQNPYGRIKSAWLLLRGKLAPLPTEITLNPGDEERCRFGYLGNKMGTVLFDWAVAERTVQKAQRLEILLVASCCQATSNEVLEYYANPDEDHTATFAEPPPSTDLDDLESLFNDANKVLSSCSSCQDETKRNNAWGILLHPAPSPGAYYRVGVCSLFGACGGLDIFRGKVSRDIKII